MRDRSFTDSDGLLPVVVMCSSKDTMDGMKCVANCVPPALSTENIPSETAERGGGSDGFVLLIVLVWRGGRGEGAIGNRETDGGKILRYFFWGRNSISLGN